MHMRTGVLGMHQPAKQQLLPGIYLASSMPTRRAVNGMGLSALCLRHRGILLVWNMHIRTTALGVSQPVLVLREVGIWTA